MVQCGGAGVCCRWAGYSVDELEGQSGRLMSNFNQSQGRHHVQPSLGSRMFVAQITSAAEELLRNLGINLPLAKHGEPGECVTK